MKDLTDESEPRCKYCGHRESDHDFRTFIDAQPCKYPGCDCDAFCEVEPDDEGGPDVE